MSTAGHPLKAFTAAAVWVFIPSLPVTHALGLVAHCPRAARSRHVLAYPFKGGRHHTVFQLIAWVVWAASLAVAVPVLLLDGGPGRGCHAPESHSEVLAAAAALGSVFAELFMIQSLLVFDPQVSASLAGGSGGAQPSSPAYNRRSVPSKPLAGTVVVAMGALWVALAGALVWATEYLEHGATKQAYVAFSLACLLVGITTTHGLGGQLWHAAERRADGAQPAHAWRFWQPFRGGAAFVATQALGWALFTAALTSLAWLGAQIAAGVAHCIRCWTLGTCSVMAAAYLVLGASIWTFQAAAPPPLKRAAQEAARRRLPWHRAWPPILALYTPVHMFCCAAALSFALLPAAVASALWAGGLTLYFLLTSQGVPQHTGCREWPAVRGWLCASLEPALRAWFGSVEVAFEDAAALSDGRQYVFGYAPHGLFPLGAPYLPLLPQFRAALPRLSPVPLIASVCFYTPVVRDICSWVGVRQVSRATFVRVLREGRSVLLVPGGQAELVHTSRFHRQRELVIYRRHKGFVRLALEQGASLVPVLCLGEIGALRNWLDWPAMQRWTYKHLGFPIPYLVVGRWGATPFPRRTGLRFVIGAPIHPPPGVAPGQPVDEAVVVELHGRFYAAVERLFAAHQPSFPGYEDVRLVMV